MSNRLIAIIEDDYTKKSQLKALLEKAGYKVASFGASPKIINELLAFNPAIIITDKDPANAKNPFWIIDGLRKEPRLKGSEIFAYLKEIEVKDEVALRKLKISSLFTKTNKISYLVEGVGKHFSLQALPKEFDPWAQHLERQEQRQDQRSYGAPAPQHAPQPGMPPPAAAAPHAPASAPAPRPSQPAPAGVPPKPQAAPAPQKPSAPPPAAPGTVRQPLIPSPASMAQKHGQTGQLTSLPDFSDFLTTIGDSVIKAAEPKKAPAISPALDNFNKGMEFYKKEQHPQALIMFEKSRQDKMLQARSLVMIGKIHRHMNNMNAAIATFKEAHHSADDMETKLESRYEIAETMKIQGKIQDAYNMFATVYKTDKNFKDTRNKLIELKALIK